MVPIEEEIPAKRPPTSVPTAYDLSVKSMDAVIRRFENQDANLDRVITWISGFTAAGVAVLAAKHSGSIHFSECPFYWAVACFMIAVAVALFGKFAGQVKIIDPKLLYEGQLDLDEYEFKKNHIYYLGQNFEAALKDTRTKWYCGLGASFFFCLEITFLVFWAASGF